MILNQLPENFLFLVPKLSENKKTGLLDLLCKDFTFKMFICLTHNLVSQTTVYALHAKDKTYTKLRI